MARDLRPTLPSQTKKKWLTTLRSSAGKKDLGGRQPEISVVIDTNVWYSAIVFGGDSERCIEYCLEKTRVVLSDEILHELRYLLKDVHKAPYRWVNTFIGLVDEVCEVCVPSQRVLLSMQTEIRDPKDEHVVAVAVDKMCDVIISGDRDLTTLSDSPVLVVNPSAFLLFIK